MSNKDTKYSYSNNLNGLVILVTRPKEKNQELCKLITAHGGEYISLPSIEISPIPNTSQQIKKNSNYDDIIFVSPNAVLYSLKYITIRPKTRVIAIGNSTRDYLIKNNIQVEITPYKQCSEALLNEPGLNLMKNRQVLIIRGNGGRSLLGQTLRNRGAQVNYANVYNRTLPEINTSLLQKKWKQMINMNIIIATSNQTLYNLLRLCHHYYDMILQTPLLVVSNRIKKYALQLGFQKNIYISLGTTNYQLIKTLCYLVNSKQL